MTCPGARVSAKTNKWSRPLTLRLHPLQSSLQWLKGEVTPGGAAGVMGVLLSHKQIIETADLEARIATLEWKAK